MAVTPLLFRKLLSPKILFCDAHRARVPRRMMEAEALEASLQLAIENVFSFLAGTPRNVVTGPKG